MAGVAESDSVLEGIRRLSVGEDPSLPVFTATGTPAEDEATFLRTGLRTIGSVRTLPHYDCPLCHEKVHPPAYAVEIIACSHAFHRSCLFDWLHSDDFWHSSCPVCRVCLFPTRHPHTPALTNDSPIAAGFATARSILTGDGAASHTDLADALFDRLNDLSNVDKGEEETRTRELRTEEKEDPDESHTQADRPGVVIMRSTLRAAARRRRSEDAEEA